MADPGGSRLAILAAGCSGRLQMLDVAMITYVASFVPPRSDRRAFSAVGYGLIAAVLVTIIVAGFSAMGASVPEAVVTVSSDLR